MGASVRPIPASLRDAIARAVVPQSTQVGMGRPVTLSAPFANLPLSRMGPQVPGAIPLPQGTLPDQTQDVGSIARTVAGAVGQGTGITPAFHAGQALSSGRGFDRLGGKQPIAGPLLTAALTAAPLATGEAGPMVRAIGDEATAGVKALAPEFTSVVSDALSRARINDLNARDVLRSALKAQESPLGPMEIRTSASSAAPGQGFMPSRTVPPDAAALQQMEIPTTARRSLAQAVMDSVATMPLKGTKVVDAEGNPRVVYHGTSAAFDKFDPNKLSPDALYGPGIYHTENPTVAGGTQARLRTNVFHGPFPSEAEAREEAADISRITGGQTSVRQRPDGRWEFVEDAEVITGKKGYANKGEGEAPNIRPARLAITNPFDADAPVSGAETSKIIDALQQRLPSGYTPMLESLRTGYGSTGVPRAADLYDMLARTGADRARVNAALKDAGYDGITHMGGANTGTAPHRVWIAFDPSQVRSAFDPIESARQVGGFVPPIVGALTAGARPSSTSQARP